MQCRRAVSGGLPLDEADRPAQRNRLQRPPDVANPRGPAITDIFQIREAPDGDLLVEPAKGSRGSRRPLPQLLPPDPLDRRGVFDALEDQTGGIWLALPGGLSLVRKGVLRIVVPGGPLLNDFAVTLCQTRDGADMVRHIRQGLVARTGLTITATTSTVTGFPATRSVRCTKIPRVRCWISTFGGGLKRAEDEDFGIHCPRRIAQRQRRQGDG